MKFNLEARAGALTALAILVPATAFAAGTGSGVEAGFADITNTMTTLLTGAGGYLVLIISIIVAAVTLMATGRWTYVITAVAVSLFLGYGLNIVSSIGGVSATIDMVSVSEAEPDTQI
jgi:type IV secretory pathway VirB2 component (pilin)